VALMKSSSRVLQRQVDLTTAVCQERLLATHVRHVLAFVDLVSDRLPFDDALDIYVRILRLSPEQARNIGSRVLAELGRRDGVSKTVALLEDSAQGAEAEREEEPGERQQGEARSDALFGRLRRRVRGRVQEELRNRINLSAARTEDALLETHVDNSLIFVRALAKQANEPEAVELYLETMMLPEGVADVIYNRALGRIADRVLPRVPEGELAGEDVEIPTAPASHAGEPG
jgi:hypothetical protein